jgi:hypothetical protein
MSLGKNELEHIKKVLTSDKDECSVHISYSKDEAFKQRMKVRRKETKRVLALVDEELGEL